MQTFSSETGKTQNKPQKRILQRGTKKRYKARNRSTSNAQKSEARQRLEKKKIFKMMLFSVKTKKGH